MEPVVVVEKFGPDDFLERSWRLPADAVDSLRAHVEVTSDGWVVDVWPVTAEMAAIVQPWVGEPVDSGSGSWFVGPA